MNKDLFAKIKKTNMQQTDPANYRGKGITISKCEKPEMRIFIRESDRTLRAATFSDSAIRGNCVATKKRYYYEIGATVVRPYEVASIAKKSGYNLAKFKKLVGERLGRGTICTSEAIELVHAAEKHNSIETLGATRKEVPKGVKIYAIH